MTSAICTCRITLLTLQTLMLWISYANITEVCLLILTFDSPPWATPQRKLSEFLLNLAYLRHPCTPVPREMWLSFAGFEPVISCIKLDGCPSYQDSSSQTFVPVLVAPNSYPSSSNLNMSFFWPTSFVPEMRILPSARGNSHYLAIWVYHNVRGRAE